MLVSILLTVILSIVGAILYRLGGIGKPFNTKHRDLGVPLVSVILLVFLGISSPWWIWLLTFLAMFGVMTTYFEFDNDVNTNRNEWLLCGFMYGISALPYALFHGVWIGFILRTIFLTIFTMIWSEKVDKDWLEEGGRGLAFVVTIPLLLIK